MKGQLDQHEHGRIMDTQVLPVSVMKTTKNKKGPSKPKRTVF